MEYRLRTAQTQTYPLLDRKIGVKYRLSSRQHQLAGTLLGPLRYQVLLQLEMRDRLLLQRRQQREL